MTGPRAEGMDRYLAPVLGRRLSILGSTGSIGASTLDVVRYARAHYGEEAFPIEALTAHTNVTALADAAKQFRAKVAVIGDDSLLDRKSTRLNSSHVSESRMPSSA